MTTPRKKWPHNAEWTRLDCIALARRGRGELLIGLDAVDDPGVLRRMAKAMEVFREIEAKLLEAGNRPKETRDEHE